jgi:hypothetical protein
MVWQTDKVIPSMLIFMCCALYSVALFFILVNILSETVWLHLTCSTNAPIAFDLFYSYATWSPSYFLGAGCMLNLNKWIYFYMRILAFIKVGKGIHEFDTEELRSTN